MAGNSSYWLNDDSPSPSPVKETLANASYWESSYAQPVSLQENPFANVVYSTGSQAKTESTDAFRKHEFVHRSGGTRDPRSRKQFTPQNQSYDRSRATYNPRLDQNAFRPSAGGPPKHDHDHYQQYSDPNPVSYTCGNQRTETNLRQSIPSGRAAPPQTSLHMSSSMSQNERSRNLSSERSNSNERSRSHEESTREEPPSDPKRRTKRLLSSLFSPDLPSNTRGDFRSKTTNFNPSPMMPLNTGTASTEGITKPDPRSRSWDRKLEETSVSKSTDRSLIKTERDPRQRSRSKDRKSTEISSSISSSSSTTDKIKSRERIPPPDRPLTLTQQNIDEHKLSHESNTEWDLRRKFLLTHMNNYPLNKLECLSQVFINVECFGCRYPDATMRLVRGLSGHMSAELDKHREERSEKTGIKFVKEEEPKTEYQTNQLSSVSSDRVLRKRKSTDDLQNATTRKKPIAFVRPSCNESLSSVTEKQSVVEVSCEEPVEEMEGEADPDDLPNMTKEDTDSDSQETTIENEKEEVEIKSPNSQQESVVLSKRQQRKQLLQKKFNKVSDNKDAVPKHEEIKQLYARNKFEETMYDLASSLERIDSTVMKKNHNSIERVYQTINSQSIKLAMDIIIQSVRTGLFTCQLVINSVVLASGEGTTKKSAKHAASDNALLKLRKLYLRVERLNPERQELQASDYPFMDPNAGTQQLTVLGGKEVARRGMKRARSEPRHDFILVDYSNKCQQSNASVALVQSANFNKIPIKFVFDESAHPTCRILIDEDEVACVSAVTKPLAKLNASEKALEMLQKNNWTIKIKGAADTDLSGMTRDELLGDLNADSDVIPTSNIGSKLLAKMGWTGGGVGKSGQGIAAPIKADTTLVRREGFGMSVARGLGRDFKTRIRDTLNEYCRSSRQDDLRFSPEFTNEERAVVHTEARKLGLRSRSYGAGSDRYLVVGRKRSSGELFQHVMTQGGSTSKYDLIPPLSMTSHGDEVDE